MVQSPKEKWKTTISHQLHMNICVPVKASMRLNSNGKATIQGKTNSEMEKALEKFVEILRELGYDTKSKPCYLVTSGSFSTADMGGGNRCGEIQDFIWWNLQKKWNGIAI